MSVCWLRPLSALATPQTSPPTVISQPRVCVCVQAASAMWAARPDSHAESGAAAVAADPTWRDSSVTGDSTEQSYWLIGSDITSLVFYHPLYVCACTGPVMATTSRTCTTFATKWRREPRPTAELCALATSSRTSQGSAGGDTPRCQPSR